MSVNLEGVMILTDWNDFRAQKTVLLAAINQYPELEGLLNWIDCVQDAVVEEEIVSAKEVFGIDLSND